MIKFNVGNIKDLSQEAFDEIENIEDVFDKFKYETKNLLDNNSDEKMFRELELQMEDILPKMKDLVVNDIKEVFLNLEKSMDVVESVDAGLKKGIDSYEN